MKTSWNSFGLTSILLLALLVGVEVRAQLLSDDFNDGVINSSLWVPYTTTVGNSTISESGSRITLVNGAGITTKAGFNRAVVRGRFQIKTSDHDRLFVVLRSDGQTFDPHWQDPHSGIGLSLHATSAPDANPAANVRIYDFVTATYLATGMAQINVGVDYDFLVVDSGTNMSVYIGNFSVPVVTAGVNTNYGNRVQILNRSQLAPWGPTQTLEIDFVTVEDKATALGSAVAVFDFDGDGQDSSGNGNHSTPAGNFQYLTNGLSGRAVRTIGDNSQYFAGGGHVMLPTVGSNLNGGTTFSFWVRDEVQGTALGAELGMYVSFGANNDLHIVPHAAAVIWAMHDLALDKHAEYRMSTNMPIYFASGWKHLALAYAPGKFACFYNGQKLYETNFTANVFPTSHAALNRSWWDNGASSQARMSATYDNLRIYNRALSDAEIQQLYLLERPTCTPRQATATAVLFNGFVVDATVTDGGCGYLEPPNVIIEGGGGAGANAVAEVVNGVVTAVRILNAGFGYTSAPSIVIDIPPMPPKVTLNPTNMTILAGTTATFAASATGSSPLRFQWFNGTNRLEAATNAILSITNCQVADSGFYSMAVTNSYGAVTSSPVKLWVTTNTFDLGMVAYYPFNSNANDESGNGLNAQIYGNSGNVSLISDRLGITNSAYRFGATVGGIDPVIWGTGMNLAGTSLTISFWIRGMYKQVLDDYGGVGVGTIPPGTPNPGGSAGKNLSIFSSYEKIRFSFFYNDCDAPQTVPVGQWAQLCFVFDNSTMNRKIFINGKEVANCPAAYGFSGNDIFSINGRNGVSMDDVRFYNRALTLQEVQQLYAVEFPDADKDGLSDYEETSITHTDPTKWDTDSDGLGDYSEVRVHQTDPLKADTDGDGYNDFAEIYAGKSPKDAAQFPGAYLGAFTAIELEFIGKTGTSYMIQSSPDLTNWTNLEGPIVGDGNIWTKLYSTRENTNRFYRVEKMP